MTAEDPKSDKPWLWKKGTSANPKGRPGMPDHLKAISVINATEIRGIFSKYGRMTSAELETLVKEGNLPVVDLAICSVWVAAVSRGDHNILAFILDRTCGRLHNKPMADGEGDKRMAELRAMPLEALVKEAEAAFPSLRGIKVG
jgi:hypothetical protein